MFHKEKIKNIKICGSSDLIVKTNIGGKNLIFWEEPSFSRTQILFILSP
jgi:hypothetical protein